MIDRSYPLADIAQAITYAATEKTRGKVVITVSEAAAALARAWRGTATGR